MSGKTLVVRTSTSSVRPATRISSLASDRFDRSNRGFWRKARATEGAVASRATGTKRRSASALRPSTDERCQLAGSRAEVVWRMKEGC